MAGARRRARKHNVPFALSFSDIRVPLRCPALGIKLSPGTGVSTDASPTLDRIVRGRGYVPGNVIVVSNLANRIKSSATAAQVMRVAHFYEMLSCPTEHPPGSGTS